MVTVGSQMALDLVTRIFCDPGDVVLAEAPSYVGALGTFAAYQAQVVHVAMDDDGLVPERCATALDARRRPGDRVKFLYTIPNFHNPAGVTLAVERRAEVLRDLRATHGVLVVEDNPYGLLGFDGQTYPALRSLDRDNVIYLGSFSKTFAAGPAGGLGAGAARGAGEAGAGRRGGRRCARRASPRCWSRGTWPTHDWREPDQDLHARPTGSGATRCSRALETLPAGRLHVDRARTAGSTSG